MKKLIRLRQLAYAVQRGHCFYCGFRMWIEHPEEVFGTSKLSSKVASNLKCTAEHLKPLSEGGKNEPGNVVAACQHCNWTRHVAKKVLIPERYGQRVRGRVARGRWHDMVIRRAFSTDAELMGSR